MSRRRDHVSHDALAAVGSVRPLGSAGLFDPTPPLPSPAPAAEPAPPVQPQRPSAPTSTRTLLLDADPVAWKAAYFAASGPWAAETAAASVRKLMGRLRAGRAVACLSDPSRRYFRHTLLEAYKPSRQDRPPFFDDAVSGLKSACAVRWLPGLEADDVIGILATCGSLGDDLIIVGDDKDLLTIPGQHHLPTKGTDYPVSEAEAATRHLLQTLTGDSGDGYPGCPKIGPVKAEKVVSLGAYLASPAGAWAAVVNTFVAAGLTEADALLQARLARICRASEFDMQTKTVRLWQPPADSCAEVAHAEA